VMDVGFSSTTSSITSSRQISAVLNATVLPI
jgi:hypothetical protein